MEDSLYWIAYATQPSNIQQHAVDPSPLVMPGTEKNEGTVVIVFYTNFLHFTPC